MVTTTNNILKRIRGKGRGSAFTAKDFLDLGSRAAVDQALSRLVRRGNIRRLGRGIYDYPKTNPRIGKLSASPNAVAKAVAKTAGSHLQISGAQAANLLGLSTQVPARTVYLTDGRSKRISIGKQTIELRHASPKRMALAGTSSGIVIQALRHIGQRHIDANVIKKIKDLLSDDDKALLRKDVANAPDWLRPIVDDIAS